LANNPSADIESELRRRERISDQMLTAHSILRDRYSRRALALDILLVFAGSLLCATTFLDPSVGKYIGVGTDGLRFILGASSISVFILSLIVLRVDWKEKTTRHQEACRSLAHIKAGSRELLAAPEHIRDSEGPEFLRTSAFCMSQFQPIPDAAFIKLKAKHREKIKVSRLLDQYPSAPLWVMRLKLRAADTCSLIRSCGTSRGENHDAES
jgi:hypothetical protein